MAERILMNEFKGLLKEKWVHAEVSSPIERTEPHPRENIRP